MRHHTEEQRRGEGDNIVGMTGAARPLPLSPPPSPGAVGSGAKTWRMGVNNLHMFYGTLSGLLGQFHCVIVFFRTANTV
jgi:hypothetical protein